MSANRDERVFERPFAFDIARFPNKHLGFGAGVHFFQGSVLARLELRVVFEELLRSGLNFKQSGARVSRAMAITKKCNAAAAAHEQSDVASV